MSDLIKPGQGRSASSLEHSANVAALCLVVAVALLVWNWFCK